MSSYGSAPVFALKRQFIGNDGEKDQIFSSAHPECKHLASKWVEKLQVLFADLFGITDKIHNLQRKVGAAKDDNHPRKVEKYRKNIRKEVDKMRKLITFKAFMRCLRTT
ncbi:hypothetical protein OBBRIDRAFT_892181 [Obba rivulosa]|uniref:Uncharacterized protein n=1 Tax=Obba rivulosa TaxID=1052685 RepID=A0A8E2AFV5_9APHY|nr:hypothetical protein OBBRIDRAFT_892181 [Obba rivulosa]